MATIITSTNGISDMEGFALRIREDSFLLDEAVETNDICSDVPGSKCIKGSPYILPALASTTSNDPLHNDYFSVLYNIPLLNPNGRIPTWLGTVTFALYEYTAGTWSEIASLGDNTYGTFYPLGTYADYNTFTGYKLDWQSILNAFGDGFYRIVATRTILGVETDVCHPIHCLQEYNEDTANQTVRFEWNDNGILSFETGTDFSITNYGNINWREMIRLKGFFGRPEDLDEVVEVTRARDNFYETARIKHEKSYKYEFVSSLYPDWVHSKIKDIGFMSNSLQVTDYNLLNQHTYQRLNVLKTPDGYTPEYNTYNKCFRVSVAFSGKKQDLGLRQCKVVTSGNCADVTIKDDNGNVIDNVPSGGTYVEGGSSNDQTLLLAFGAANADVITETVEAAYAALYTIESLTNVATVVYKINTVVTVLPFTLVAGDTFETTITRTTLSTYSEVLLTGSY